MIDDDDDDVRLRGDENYIYIFGTRTVSPMPMAKADRTWHGWRRRRRMDLGASALRPGGRCKGHGVGLPSDGRRRGGFLCGERERGGGSEILDPGGPAQQTTHLRIFVQIRTDFFMVDFSYLLCRNGS